MEKEPNLTLQQGGEVVDILVEENRVKGIVTRTGAVYYADAVILATGTYLKGVIFMGEVSYSSGPGGTFTF